MLIHILHMSLCMCTKSIFYVRHRVRLSTLKLLLERGADPNVSRVPMPVLFLAIMAADTEAVRRLLLCGARTDIPLPPEVEAYFLLPFFGVTLLKKWRRVGEKFYFLY